MSERQEKKKLGQESVKERVSELVKRKAKRVSLKIAVVVVKMDR